MNVILLLSDDDNDDGAIKSLGMSYDFKVDQESYFYSKDKGAYGHQWEEVERNNWFTTGEDNGFDLHEMAEEEDRFDLQVESLKESGVTSFDDVRCIQSGEDFRLVEVEPGTGLLDIEELTREALVNENERLSSDLASAESELASYDQLEDVLHGLLLIEKYAHRLWLRSDDDTLHKIYTGLVDETTRLHRIMYPGANKFSALRL